MNNSTKAASPRKTRGGCFIAVLTCHILVGCQSPNVFTAKNDAKSSSSVEPASATSQQAGLPTPTNAAVASHSQPLTTIDEHLRLGETELEQGNYSQAQIHFDHVLQQQPNHLKANHRLGVLADKQGQYSRAEMYYRAALEGDPRNAALLSDLGYSYWLQGRYSDSERYLLEARKSDPNYEKAIANLGLLYGSTGRREEALAMLAHIGDVAEVQQIMQQIADGQFQPPQHPREQMASQQQTSVVTTQTTAQHAAPVAPQDMNTATREFVEQMRLAREELRRAEAQLASHQAQVAAHPPQNGITPAGGQVPPEWAQQAVAARPDGLPATQYAGVTPFPHHPSGQGIAQQGPLPDARLAEQLAAIDRHNQRTPDRGPVVVAAPNSNADSMSRQAPFPGQFPIIQSGPSSSGQSARPIAQPAQSPVEQRPEFSTTTATAPQYWPSRGQGQPVQQSEQPVNLYGNQPSHTENSFAQEASQSSTTNPSAWQRQYGQSLGQPASSQHGTPPLSDAGFSAQPIQQLSASNTQSAQRPVEHAYHTQQYGQRPDIALTGQSDAPSSSLVPPSLRDHQASQPQQMPTGSNNGQPSTAANSYEQARRQAALMGLGAGPGQVFPYIQQTPRSMPGTDSRMNGSEYPAPVRHMPSGLIPPGSNSGFSNPAPMNFAPANNDLGQPMPAVPVPMRDPGAYPGSASTDDQYDQRTAPSAMNETSPTAPYQDARAQQSDQLNGLINQTWGQSPQSPPYGVTPPSSMNQYAAPTTQSSRPTTAPSEIQATQTMSPANHSPSNWGTAVVPEPYRADSPNTGAVQRPSQQSWTDQTGTTNARTYEGPVIVPSRR